MYAEVCAFLTGNKYLELPSYRVSGSLLIDVSSIDLDLLETYGQFHCDLLFGYFHRYVSGGYWRCDTFGLEV